MTDEKENKENHPKDLEGFIEKANEMYLDGKESTKEYKDLCINMARFITANNSCRNPKSYNPKTHYIDRYGNILSKEYSNPEDTEK